MDELKMLGEHGTCIYLVCNDQSDDCANLFLPRLQLQNNGKDIVYSPTVKNTAEQKARQSIDGTRLDADNRSLRHFLEKLYIRPAMVIAIGEHRVINRSMEYELARPMRMQVDLNHLVPPNESWETYESHVSMQAKKHNVVLAELNLAQQLPPEELKDHPPTSPLRIAHAQTQVDTLQAALKQITSRDKKISVTIGLNVLRRYECGVFAYVNRRLVMGVGDRAEYLHGQTDKGCAF